MYESDTCATCFHHRDSVGITGECRALPPDQPTAIPMVMTYKRTADILEACGLYRPRVEPELPVAESKAERIERMRREGVTDLVAWKRVLEGR